MEYLAGISLNICTNCPPKCTTCGNWFACTGCSAGYSVNYDTISGYQCYAVSANALFDYEIAMEDEQ